MNVFKNLQKEFDFFRNNNRTTVPIEIQDRGKELRLRNGIGERKNWDNIGIMRRSTHAHMDAP